jgi:pimeloyl-ACP methyl ester carboxylesterase
MQGLQKGAASLEEHAHRATGYRGERAAFIRPRIPPNKERHSMTSQDAEKISKRSLLAGSLAGGLASLSLGACGGGGPGVASSLNGRGEQLPTIVLIHGSLHGSFCWSRVTPFLVEAGFKVLAIDLPGCGLNGRFPTSSYARPFDADAYSTERSPLASLTLADYARYTGDIVDRLYANTQEPLVLVGHSLGGITLNAVGESHASKIRNLIYVSAVIPASGETVGDCFATKSAFAASYVAQGKNGSIRPMADIGAGRFDLNTPDPAVRSAIRSAYCGDVSDEDFLAWANLLVPDDARGPQNGKTVLTGSNWGSIPRSYIKCMQDKIIPPALADEIMAALDKLTPGNKTVVETLDTSHSPFLSKPQELAQLINRLARR